MFRRVAVRKISYHSDSIINIVIHISFARNHLCTVASVIETRGASLHWMARAVLTDNLAPGSKIISWY